MNTYVLIHGAWHGSWCWTKVASLLERAGHKVLAPDLPAHGEDTTSLSQVSLQSYAERVCEVVNAQDEPVILVGHSMGGMAISQAAEYCADNIKILVYVCAFLLRNGESLLEVTQSDQSSRILPNLIDNEDGSASLQESSLEEMFFAGCSTEETEFGLSGLRPEPMAPVATPITITEENFGSLPRVYIECLDDVVISPAVQKRMVAGQPCQKVFTMNTGHSPFLSATEELVGYLMSLENEIQDLQSFPR